MLSAVLVALSATAAQAQSVRPDRPYRGLFGSSRGDADQSLTMNLSFGAGYDDAISRTQADSTTFTGLPSSGFYAGWASLQYHISKSRVGVYASLDGTIQYYTVLKGQPLAHSYGGQAGATFAITSTTSASVRANMTSTPWYYLPVLGTSVDLRPNKAFASKVRDSLVAQFGDDLQFNLTPHPGVQAVGSTPGGLDLQEFGSVGAGLSQQITKRVSLYANIDKNTYAAGGGAGDLDGFSAGGGVSVAIAQGASLRVGYHYTERRAPDGSRLIFRGGNGSTGFSFGRAISLTKRSQIAFATGIYGGSDLQDRTHYGVSVTAKFNREIGRTWNAFLLYDRGGQFFNALQAFVESDAGQVGFGGLVNEKLQFYSGIGVRRGNVGFVAQGNRFNSGTASAGVLYGITEDLGVNVDYSFYRYWFDNSVVLPPNALREMNRQALRVSLSLWVPLLHSVGINTRSDNAAR
jgi:hypothetical protein